MPNMKLSIFNDDLAVLQNWFDDGITLRVLECEYNFYIIKIDFIIID